MKALIALTAVAFATAFTPAFAEESTADKPKDSYPLTTCVVSGQKLGSMGEPHTIQHEGREVRFCCARCEPRFQRDPAKYLKKLDEATAKAQQAEGKKPAACCPGH